MNTLDYIDRVQKEALEIDNQIELQTLYIKTLENDMKKEAEKHLLTLKKARYEKMIHVFDFAFRHGYTLTIDDIEQQLDVSNKYIRTTLLRNLDYFTAIKGASDVFNRQNSVSKNLSYIQRRLLKWKKIFIQRDSLAAYYENNLFIEIPFTPLTWDETKTVYTANPIETYRLPFKLAAYDNKYRFYRKSSLKGIIQNLKLKEFKRKTEDDLMNENDQLVFINDENLRQKLTEELKQIRSLTLEDLRFPVSDTEVERFLEKNSYYRCYFYSEEDQAKPTCLYLFLNDISFFKL